MIQLRWPWRSFGALAAFWGVTLAALLASGFPRWRVAVIAGCWLAQAAAILRFAVRGTAPMELGTFPPGALRLGMVGLVSSTVAIALTGALHGPMFVTLLMPAITTLALFGAARECGVLVGATAACIALLGALPGAWIGPALPRAAFDVLATASVVATATVVGTNVFRLRAALRESGRELARVREELAAHALARARSLEEIGAQVAHELKNPLSAVKALAQLGAGEDGPQDARDAFAAIDGEVSRLQAILRDYLSFTRPLEELRPERVQLGPLADEVLAALATSARRAGVSQRRRGDASIVADPRHLAEALLNLVANAIEATPAGGAIDVEIGEDGGATRVVIRDTGRGMPPHVLARLGTPFFTTRETGTGLGVVLARSVIQQHGGAVRFESAPGSGTTVTVTLPFEAPRRASDREAPGTGAAGLRLQLPWRGAAVGALYNAVVIGSIWAGGLPRARAIGVALFALVHFLPSVWYAARAAPPAPAGTYPPTALFIFLVHVVASAGQMALTGGLASPFLATALGPAIVSLALFDDVWQTRLVVGATAATVVLVALVPGVGASTQLAPVAHGVLVGAAAIAVLLILATNLVRAREVLSASGRELGRARDALASHAVARARSLEEVGAKVARELERPLAEVGRLAQSRLGAAAGARTRQWFEVIQREVARMQEILAEYLSFARPLQSFRPERVDLGPLVADVLAVLSGRAARAGVREDCRGDASITGDPRRLKEALLNLVANAIDATPAGGRVEVEVGGEGGQARIAIHDTGHGMAPDVLERVGTPFFTTHEAGTGLGVVLARSVFHRHGGGLRYESAPGRGTTVTATLPLEPGDWRTHGERAPGR